MSSSNPQPPKPYPKLSHTPSGTPYLTLPLSHPTPIYITPFYPTDSPAIQSILSLPSINSRLISIPHPYTLTHASSWISLQLTGKCTLPLAVLRAHDPETGPLIGNTSLIPVSFTDENAPPSTLPKVKNPEENEVELGYYLHPEWAGRGIMRAAVREVVEWAREVYGAEVVIRVAEDNEASKRVVESFGEFKRVEERDDREDWPESKGGGNRKCFFWRWEVEG